MSNPGKLRKSAPGKKEVVSHTLESGAHLEQREAGWIWGCFVLNGKSELSAFLPMAFSISTKVFCLLARCELHPDRTSPFSSSK